MKYICLFFYYRSPKMNSEHLWNNENKITLAKHQNEGRQVYSQDLIHQQALKFIRENKDKPFMATLTYTLPYAELNLPHDSIYQQYENKFDEKAYEGGGNYHSVEKPRRTKVQPYFSILGYDAYFFRSFWGKYSYTPKCRNRWYFSCSYFIRKRRARRTQSLILGVSRNGRMSLYRK